MNLNNRTSSHPRILLVFPDNTGLTIRNDLVRFEDILFFKNGRWHNTLNAFSVSIFALGANHSKQKRLRQNLLAKKTTGL